MTGERIHDRMTPTRPTEGDTAGGRASLCLAYYGDDFTGSTDVLEALSRAGISTVLFLRPPTAQQLARFPGIRAFGVAGGSRTLTPERMERELPPAFEALRASGAPIIHYKMCSTFDSSPTTGSVGRAIELGRKVFGEQPTPLVVGAPVLGRYVVFGNLFARSGLDTEPYRLDRHPTMSRHPVTPMTESDLRRVLAAQTALPVELVDVLQLEQLGDRGWTVAPGMPAPVILFDTLREAHLPVIGRVIEDLARNGPLFVVGSSGIEYALVAHWRCPASYATADACGIKNVDQLVCVSGSCSPVTARQIAVAEEQGFAALDAGPGPLADEGARNRLLEQALALLGQGRSVVLRSSRGPEDACGIPGMPPGDRERLGLELGGLLERLLERTGLPRAVVCGGDTSTDVARAMGVEALEYRGPMAPGSPVCRVHAPGRVAHEREIVFKGGQVGHPPFFSDVLCGVPGAP